MKHSDRDALIPDLLPAFRGIPYEVRGGSARDLADVIAEAEGRAVRLKASELRAIGERLRSLQLALESATQVSADTATDAYLREMEEAEREAVEAFERLDENVFGAPV